MLEADNLHRLSVFWTAYLKAVMLVGNKALENKAELFSPA